MNVIGNNCIGAYFMNEWKEEYKNPFIWHILLFNDMLNLIKNYDNINFLDYEIAKSELKPGYLNTFKLLVNNKITIHYPHYKFKADENVPKVIHVDVYYNKIWEYVVKKYEKRLLRMTEKPCFLIIDGHGSGIGKWCEYTKEQDEQLLQLETLHKIVLITKYKELLKYNSKNKLVIYDTSNRANDPSYYAKLYRQIIKDFIET